MTPGLALIARRRSSALWPCSVGLADVRVLSETRRPSGAACGRPSASPTTGVLLDAPALTPEETEFVKQLSAVVPRSPKDMTRLRRRFVRAGYYTLTPVAIYTLAQLVLPVVVRPASRCILARRSTQSWMLVLIGAVVRAISCRASGWCGRSRSARSAIQNGLPDLLDLMIVCLEAGSALDQAIVKSTDELEIAYPALAEEFRLLVTETRAGKPRLEAFRNLASRTGVDDIRALVAMLVQTDRFGTSVSQALRTHAERARTKRRQRAEERAAKIGVKLVFPLVFCCFPAFFVVTLGPAVIQFVRVFFGQVMGQ